MNTTEPPSIVDFPWLSAAAVARARVEAAKRGVSITQCLEAAAGLEPASFVKALGQALRYRVASADDLRRWTPAFDLVAFDEALKQRAVLFRNKQGRLRLAFSDPFNPDKLAWGDDRIAEPFVWVLAHEADLLAVLSKAGDGRAVIDAAMRGADEGGTRASQAEEVSLQAIADDASPIVRAVNSTLFEAHRAGASDIHLETGGDTLTIKYRVDGVLSEAGTIAGASAAEQVISRIKVMAELDIAERRVPQDGRIKIAVRGREIDLRVSIMPSVFGEDAVLRILDKQALADGASGLTLATLGFDEPTRKTIRRLAQAPYGMLLVTGPTGSGKTTTLYAALSESRSPEEKIITIEDPVEYQLPGVLQIPVNEKKGLSFARGLRSVLRHDPDKIMVGEIRDAETAQIAIQAALTGHLVFTTVHANNVFDVLGRFTHMQVDPFTFVAALNGVLAQRLVRLNCPKCIAEARPDTALLAESGLTAAGVKGWRFMAGAGCAHCRNAGYKGRRAIAEVLVVNDEIREMILAKTPIRQLKEAALRNGTRFLRVVALDLVRQGLTDLREVNRVTFAA